MDKKTKRLILAILLIVGIILFLIGMGIDSGEKVVTYYKVYKDYTGTWRGRDVSYLASETNALEIIGIISAIIGGVGLRQTRDDKDKK